MLYASTLANSDEPRRSTACENADFYSAVRLLDDAVFVRLTDVAGNARLFVDGLRRRDGGQLNREARAEPLASALRLDRPVVQCDQLARQCQADAEPAVWPRMATDRLAESVEHVRQIRPSECRRRGHVPRERAPVRPVPRTHRLRRPPPKIYRVREELEEIWRSRCASPLTHAWSARLTFNRSCLTSTAV